MHWPSFKTYSGTHLRRVAFPLGGIGTGTISLGGRGNLRDFEVVNRPALGFVPPNTFFALRAQNANGELFCRALEGPIPPEDYEGSAGSRVPNHGLPRFGEAEFDAAYPLAQVRLWDATFPLRVTLQAFNPFVPNDADASGFPVAVLHFRVENTGNLPLQVSVCGNLGNFIGTDGVDGKAAGNFNSRREGEGFEGLLLQSDEVESESPFFGTLALAALSEGAEFSWRAVWPNLSWGDTLLDFWDDFSSDGRLEERVGENPIAVASLCGATEIAAGSSHDFTFLLSWHFPNRLSWTPDGKCEYLPVPDQGGANSIGQPVVGNFYTTQFSDAWNVLETLVPRLADLEAQTVAFARAFYETDLPTAVKEAAGFNLSTLRTNTLFRTPDGHFFGWEGLHDRFGSCYGSCTHVWNYEQATPFLFANIARDFREIEFGPMTGENGHMVFRVGLPLELYARTWEFAAADGQMGCLLKLFREWKLSGDLKWLRRLWPAARRSLEFCWIEGGWDADCDGVMEGCQHNTMDVEYFGPNPQMQGWYLGALRAAQEMATALADHEFATRCGQLRENGARWMDENLFNGDYYEHQIHSVPEVVAPRLGNVPPAGSVPVLQLGAGCLVDQLVGPLMAQVCDLDTGLKPENVRQTLHSIVRFNSRTAGHFNHLRSYALGDEAAVLMASYPRGNRPPRPFPYFNEVMTGFEHTLAAHLLFLGEREAGLKVVEDIRARYDGRKRNPFDEAECGRHYARAMASWTHVLALTGFDWDARTATLTFAASEKPVVWFWSNGVAWGLCHQTPEANSITVEIEVLGGPFTAQTVQLRSYGQAPFASTSPGKFLATIRSSASQ